MKQKLTIPLVTTVLAMGSSWPAAAVSISTIAEENGYIQIDGGNMFGDGVDLYVRDEQPSSTVGLFNVKWDPDNRKFQNTSSIGFTVEKCDDSVKEVEIRLLIEDYLHPIRKNPNCIGKVWDLDNGKSLYEISNIPDDADINGFYRALTEQNLIETYYGPGEIASCGRLSFLYSPTDYAYFELSQEEATELKTKLEEYTANNLPGYEVIIAHQSIDTIRVKPIEEPDMYYEDDNNPFPDWMKSIEKYTERYRIALQIYNDLGLKPFYGFTDNSRPILVSKTTENIEILNEEKPRFLYSVYDKHGDIDGDGKITMKDAMKALKLSDNANLFDDTLETYTASADIDCDGAVTMKDAMYILRYADELNLGYEPTWDELLGK